MENKVIEKEVRTPSFFFAVCNVFIVIVIMMTGLLAFHLNIHMLLVTTTIVLCFFNLALGHKFERILKAMVSSINNAMVAMFFFFIIGMAVAAWMISGCLPTLIYYGLSLLSASIFLPATFLLCSITSLACGSSWTTGGTIGVVLLGIGISIGFPEPLIIGTIIAGAYFGDKMSPVSDTTILASTVARADLFQHIGAMLYITVPAWILSLIIYTVLGFGHASAAVSLVSVAEFQAEIVKYMNVNWILILPLLVVLVMSVLRIHAIPTLMAGVFIAIPLAMIFQEQTLSTIYAALNTGVRMEIESPMIARIVNRGGVQGMMSTFSLAFLCIAMGGVLEDSGSLQVLVNRLVNAVKNSRLYPMFTIITCYIVVLCTGEQYMGILLTGSVYRDVYEKAGFERRMLSRNLEEGGTVASPLIPWTTAGAYFTGALGLSPLIYAPYAVLNYATSILGIIIPLFGLTLLTKARAEKKAAARAAKKNAAA